MIVLSQYVKGTMRGLDTTGIGHSDPWIVYPMTRSPAYTKGKGNPFPIEHNMD